MAPEGGLAAAPDIRNLITGRVQAGATAARHFAPAGPSLKTDAVAGLTGAIGSVPDGMASAVLAGVNPVYGLYASLFGPIAGGLLVSTELMLVTTTSAAAIASGQAVAGLEGAARDQALFLDRAADRRPSGCRRAAAPGQSDAVRLAFGDDRLPDGRRRIDHTGATGNAHRYHAERRQ
jgi:hypothetical protein